MYNSRCRNCGLYYTSGHDTIFCTDDQKDDCIILGENMRGRKYVPSDNFEFVAWYKEKTHV